ncbi:MAG: site-specific DNA-methyltransferase [Chloroflexi bacterium]|nr:site-specific DNA-methyltransferase [Chloroflexota bacterium]
MTDQPEKLDLSSHHIAEDKRQELLRLFPEVCTEGGKIDFERLKLILGNTVDVGKERYGMNWPGKADCFKTLQQPSPATLRPCPEESVNFDTTENLIIEGDNLEVLKLLQKSYLGKVKMIYIDPPYNTGNDFIYPDNYTESLQTYLEYTGQVDAEGKRFGTNTEADGRFHSKWLNMMYPRLYLAKNLLREDGVIFVSIDDNEMANFRRIADDIFGEENFVATLIWQKVFSPKNTAKYFSEDHDYILVFAKHKETWLPELLPRTEDANDRYANPDNDPRGPWSSSDLTARNYYGSGQYSVTGRTGKTFGSGKGRYWRQNLEKFKALDADNRIWWGENGANMPRLKRFLSEVKEGIVPQTLLLHTTVGNTQEAKKELLEFAKFENTENVLNSVKPTRLLRHLIKIGTTPGSDDIVLDFFAGSGPTGHAITLQNLEDESRRRFILVQLPEPLPVPEKVVRTIADLAKSRMTNVIKELISKDSGKLDLDGAQKQDRGFRVFKLAESNFKPWNAQGAQDAQSLEKQLELHINHILDGRSADDILYEILLKSGFPLTTPVEALTLAGKTVHSVDNGKLFICLEHGLSLDIIRAMAEKKPERVVCLDEGFSGNDQLKANAVQIFRTKGVTSFKTV